jgi:hypothetical protein
MSTCGSLNFGMVFALLQDNTQECRLWPAEYTLRCPCRGNKSGIYVPVSHILPFVQRPVVQSCSSPCLAPK